MQQQSIITFTHEQLGEISPEVFFLYGCLFSCNNYDTKLYLEKEMLELKEINSPFEMISPQYLSG